ncbi:hypothetical protein, partial [Salmonella sp. s58953]|uniref:hypothetical protein n=1 Tax=Salmonella sp. s58953 TaxID=3159711 RepID=UPI00397FAB4C
QKTKPINEKMASTSCFLHHPATISTPKTSFVAQRYGPNKPNQIVCKAQNKAQAQNEDAAAAVSRRLALSVLIGVAAVGSKVAPADAAYGESANIFGKPKSDTDYLTITGNGFKVQVPSKWNPSKEIEFPGQVLRFEDNFDPM